MRLNVPRHQAAKRDSKSRYRVAELDGCDEACEREAGFRNARSQMRNGIGELNRILGGFDFFGGPGYIESPDAARCTLQLVSAFVPHILLFGIRNNVEQAIRLAVE